MNEHICTVCFRSTEQHAESCALCGDTHWPAPCCPNCDCRSFENYHLAKPVEMTHGAAR